MAIMDIRMASNGCYGYRMAIMAMRMAIRMASNGYNGYKYGK